MEKRPVLTLKRDGVCAPSLPTTMGVVAGFLVQNTLKHLLKFGEVTHYLGYDALNDFFPIMNMKPNPNCEGSFCRKRQEEYQSRPKAEGDIVMKKEENKPLHEDNEWEISLVYESTAPMTASAVPTGLSYGYEVCDAVPMIYKETIQNDSNLEDLMAQMKSM